MPKSPEKTYPHVAQAVLGEIWAIEPAKYQAIVELVEARLAGIVTDPAAYKFSEPAPYTTDSGVRVIPMRGVMSKRANLLSAFSGGVSMEQVGLRIQEALADDAVRAIVLDIDSPGGTVDGSVSLTDLVYQARDVKPIVAFADGSCASAAYVLATACDSVVANATAQVGSIGVITTHTDKSVANRKRGILRSYITSGKWKAAGNEDEPLDDDAHGYIQARVDEAFSLLVETVARNRGVSTEEAIAMADEARVYSARAALEAGLIDRIGERADAIALAEEMAGSNPSPWGDALYERGIYPRTEGSNPMQSNKKQTYAEALALVQAGNMDAVDPAHRETIEATLRAAEAREKAETEKAQANEEANQAKSTIDKIKAALGFGGKDREKAEAPEASAQEPQATIVAATPLLDIQAVMKACAKTGLTAQDANDILEATAGKSTEEALQAVIARAGEVNPPLANVPHSRETPVDTGMAAKEKKAAEGFEATRKEMGLAT